MARVSIVVAVGRDSKHNHVIGRDNKLLWHIPDDLKRFKQLTIGHPIIMGRKTFQSILDVLGKPLPGRTNIIVTRDTTWTHEGVLVAHSIEDALTQAHAIDSEEIFVGGGTEIYTQALPYVNRLYLTEIDDEQEGDAYFPSFEDDFIQATPPESGEWNGIKYTFRILERG